MPPLSRLMPAGRSIRSAQGSESGTDLGLALAIATGLLLAAWTGFALLTSTAEFGALHPGEELVVETGAVMGRLFAAFVLIAIGARAYVDRFRWMATGLVVLALGGIVFSIAPTMAQFPVALNTALYAWLTVRTIGTFVFLLAVVGRAAYGFRPVQAIALLGGSLSIMIVVLLTSAHYPQLVHDRDASRLLAHGTVDFSQLTLLHWSLSLIPLLLTGLVVVLAFRRMRDGQLAPWILIAMVTLVATQVDTTIWPSAYDSIMTVADVLRLAFPLVIGVGAILQWRDAARERVNLLLAEREESRRLNELNLLKANFSAAVAHELAAPVAAIRWLAGNLDSDDMPPEDIKQRIEDETRNLSALIRDVRRAGVTETDDVTVRFEPVPVEALLADAESFARSLPGRHPIHISEPIDALVLADRGRINQVLRNLLDNANKYSPASAPIEIAAVDVGDAIQIAVVDHGPGVNSTDASRIFEPFNRLAGADQPGSGLGLYVSKAIVQAHHGDLCLESSSEGSRFAFQLPKAEARPSVQSQRQDERRQLLIVDDHASFRDAVVALLGSPRFRGRFEVSGAGTVAEARWLLRSCDLAIVDLSLPDGSGVEVISELRILNPGAIALVLSGSQDDVLLADAVEAGAIGLLHKSASVDEVVSAVDRALAGEDILDKSQVARVLAAARQQRQAEHRTSTLRSRLTARESEVLKAMAEGLSDKEIASRLGVSLPTARTHSMRVLGKLEAHSRLEAVVVAVKTGLIALDESEAKAS